MRNLTLTILLLSTFNFLTAEERTMPQSSDLFSKENLIAWCIVPFDSLERVPSERVSMLKELGFQKYAWDWRDKHLTELKSEIEIAQKNGIEMSAIWLWVDAKTDEVGKMSEANRLVMDTVKQAGISVQYWLGFHENFFADLTHEERVAKGSAMVSYLNNEASKSNSTIGLYNHGGWFGESANQIEIINAVDDPSVGMVYNFHHAHHEIEAFEENLQRMLPYLKAVNINGMNPGGPKIMRIGSGSEDVSMLRILRDSGYQGPIGILGHDDQSDVAKILQANLVGLETVVSESCF